MAIRLWKKKQKDAAPPPPPKPLVALLPPLMQPSAVMIPLAFRLRRAGFRTARFRYRSLRRDIPENAAELAKWLRGLGEEPVHVVAFSMGGLLLRWAANHHDIPRLGRVVMMGTPNQGAFLADWMDERLGPLFPMVWGRGALQLRRGAKGLAQRAGRLPDGVEAGVVAGGRRAARGLNPLIPGDNDSTVAVQETPLPGMKDFTLAASTHTGLVLLPRPSRAAIAFLRDGAFRPRKARGADPSPALAG